MSRIRALLRGATVAARDDARMWSARLVFEELTTHILIVSDEPARDQTINLRIEAELLRLGAPFSVTQPLVVSEPVEVANPLATYKENGRGVLKS